MIISQMRKLRPKVRDSGSHKDAQKTSGKSRTFTSNLGFLALHHVTYQMFYTLLGHLLNISNDNDLKHAKGNYITARPEPYKSKTLVCPETG